jgi:acyl-coenzyme A synthetase/AMP-(fatty) acid ligase
VLAAGATVTPDDVKRVVLAEVDAVAVPKIVDFVASLPKTDSGKVLKSELV